MDLDKSSATHVWTAGYKYFYYEALSLYKWKEGWWWVYSEITGWRRSSNSLSWFIEERKLGYFRKLTEEERNGLAA